MKNRFMKAFLPIVAALTLVGGFAASPASAQPSVGASGIYYQSNPGNNANNCSWWLGTLEVFPSINEIKSTAVTSISNWASCEHTDFTLTAGHITSTAQIQSWNGTAWQSYYGPISASNGGPSRQMIVGLQVPVVHGITYRVVTGHTVSDGYGTHNHLYVSPNLYVP